MSDSSPPPLHAANVPTATSRQTSGLAVASLVLGILSIVGGAIFFIPPILAIVFGHIALSQCSRNPALEGRGLGIAGLIMGYLGVVLGFFGAALMAAMAIPAFQKVRQESLRAAMMNDARQIGAAAMQVMLETGKTSVSFEIDPATGAVSGPISDHVKQVTKGTRAVDGVFENERDGFSLQNPQVYRGRVILFDMSGREIPADPKPQS